ncbi:MAG TPA: hypothetical protein VGB64_14820, partial [Actinomycetota bacterium]
MDDSSVNGVRADRPNDDEPQAPTGNGHGVHDDAPETVEPQAGPAEIDVTDDPVAGSDVADA